MGLVSVVLPVFNRGPVVGRALCSVLNQTYDNWEVVVVDDGSTDNSIEVIEEYIRNDSRICLVRHSHRQGAQAARNTGIRSGKGEWVAFLDSDDAWFSDSLRVRLHLAKEKGVHVAYSECNVVHPGETEPHQFGIPRMEGQVYKQVLQRPGPMFQSLLVSRKALAAIGLLDENIVSYQEWDTSIRLAKHYAFGFVGEPTFLYECRGIDTISKDSLRTARGYEQVFAKHFWPLLRYVGPRALIRHYQIAADLYFSAGDVDNARRCARKALLLWPFRAKTILRSLDRILHSGI